METNKLAALVQTVKIGSINRAAEDLGYTQSGLTYILNALESELGIKLIERSYSGILLTPDGKAVLPIIEELLSKEAELTDKIEQIKTGETVIRIGAYSSLMISWLPAVLRAFRQKHPEVSFEIRTGVVTLTKWLDEASIDIALCERSVAGGHRWEYMATDEMGVAVHKSLPIAGEESITLEMLKDYPVVYPSILRDNVVTRKLQTEHIKYEDITQIFTEDGSITLSLVSQNRCVSFITKLYRPECPKDVVIRSLTPPVYRQLGFVVHENQQSSKPIRQLVNFLKKRELVY